MDRDRFAALLDSSLQDFRDQLLDAYAGRGAGENTPATPASTKKNADTDIDEDTHDPFEVAAWKKVEHLLPSKERGVSSQTDQTDLSVGRNSSLTPSEEGIQEGPKIFHGRSSEYLRSLAAEWIHFALFWITVLPTIKLKVYTFWAYELSS